MRRSHAPSPGSPHRNAGKRSVQRGFTLVELVVCLGVVAILCGILLPSLRHTRDASLKISCASNLRQVAIAASAYSDSNAGRLPYSHVVDPRHFDNPSEYRPGDLMASRLRTPMDEQPAGFRWQGLGRLHAYLGPACECMYCPAHHGNHPRERYLRSLAAEDNSTTFTNYHYSGHVQHWLSGAERTDPARLDQGRDLVLMSDGLRTRGDFNHRTGLNRVFGDLSVEWFRDSDVPGESIRDLLPEDFGDLQVSLDSVGFTAVWSRLQETAGTRYTNHWWRKLAPRATPTRFEFCWHITRMPLTTRMTSTTRSLKGQWGPSACNSSSLMKSMPPSTNRRTCSAVSRGFRPTLGLMMVPIKGPCGTPLNCRVPGIANAGPG
ncbi:MAG: prepilin-type N-terminal cleavage/methylation domain-containing protein [Betaproteobacteria bacterium]|nr:prepilin-type N-terminal cleavage/methylation domain-containing protein [Betaproteobacteria bacterium]